MTPRRRLVMRDAMQKSWRLYLPGGRRVATTFLDVLTEDEQLEVACRVALEEQRLPATAIRDRLRKAILRVARWIEPDIAPDVDAAQKRASQCRDHDLIHMLAVYRLAEAALRKMAAVRV